MVLYNTNTGHVQKTAAGGSMQQQQQLLHTQADQFLVAFAQQAPNSFQIACQLLTQGQVRYLPWHKNTPHQLCHC